MIDLTIHEDALARAVELARERNIVIPTFKQMRNPALILTKSRNSLTTSDYGT